MKRFFTSIVFAAVFAAAVLILSASATHAQHGYRLEKQIKFAAGKTSAVIKGRIADEQETHEYKFKAKKGQFVEVRVVSRNTNLTFLISDANDEKIDDAAPKTRDWEGDLTETGEYKILVHTLEGKGVYTLYVSIK